MATQLLLGSLPFNTHTNSLAEFHFSPSSSIILYADATLLYSPLNTNGDNTLFQQNVDLTRLISNWIASSKSWHQPTEKLSSNHFQEPY